MKELTSKVKSFWGVGDLGFSFMVTVELMFFLKFLTDVAQFPLAVAAMISSITGIADMVSALLAGVFIDKMNLKGGKYRPWLIYFPILIMVLYALQFSALGSQTTSAIIVSAAFIISHALWNVTWTANRALVGVLSESPADRAFLSGRISAGATLGKMTASKLIPMAVIFFSAKFAAPYLGFTVTALTAATVMVLGYFITYFITDGYDKPVQKVETAQETQAVQADKVTFGDMIRSLVQNPPLITYALMDLLRLTGYYSTMAVAAYYSEFVLKDPVMTGNILLAFNLGAFLGSLMTKTVVSKVGSKMATIFGLAGWAASTIVAYLVSPNALMVVLFIGIGQIFFGVAYGLTTGMYSNGATYSEYHTGKNTQGFVMSVMSAAIKTSIILRGLVITVGLGAIGYVAGAPMTESVQGGISALFFLVPVFFIALSLIPMFFFRLKDEEVERMAREISARK
ncbi:MAG: MFS transporter [Eubacteriaceae bacterium]|jgi:GPH family glycoside/pentoside/hexuronide:cation symporter|nr:MFS transporter [Eubacteriaceae bacterium]